MARGIPKTKLVKRNFGIEINGFDAVLFTKGQLPKTEFGETEFKAAGADFPEKFPGMLKFEDLTFEKGMLADAADSAATDWLKAQYNIESETSGSADSYMRDVDLVLYGPNKTEKRRFTLHGAWVKKLEWDDPEGGSEDHLLEKLTICYQYWTEA